MADNVTVAGLTPLVRQLKGSQWRDVNKELRQFSRLIASDLKPLVEGAVASSGAPQAAAMSRTVRVHSDRVPVLAVGKTNPRLSGFRRKGRTGAQAKLWRGALAHGVIYGPLGGKKSTPAAENYYRISRDPSGGPLGRALQDSGHIFEAACVAYLKYFEATLKAHGWRPGAGGRLEWEG